MIPFDVLDAFGLPHEATPLMGGQGSSWRVGNYVLKPHESSYTGISEMVNQLQPTNFRVSYHHKTLTGDYNYHGWGCTHFELGEEVTGRITEKYQVAQSLHDLLAHIEIPSGWKPSDSPWSRAHEIVWGERKLPEDIHPQIYETIQKVITYLTPIYIGNGEDEEKKRVFRGQTVGAGGIQNVGGNQSIASFCPLNDFGTFFRKSTNESSVIEQKNGIFLNKQIIHGDLCGNILFHETLSPVVIDFSLDYRPREYAEAILIADSIAWENGGEEAYNLLPANSEQILLRACLFRLVTKALLRPQDGKGFQEKSIGYQRLLEKITL